MQDAELSQAIETNVRSPPVIYQRVEIPIKCQLNVAR